MEALVPIIFFGLFGLIVWRVKKRFSRSAEADTFARAAGEGPEPSPKQKRKDSEAAKKWARELLAGDLAILDTETTGLDENAEVLQVGIIDGNGEVLLDTLVKPAKATSWPKAESIHGISPGDVAAAPGFAEVAQQIIGAIGKRRVAVFNARYDARVLLQSAVAAGCKPPGFDAICIMLLDSLYRAQWNKSRGHYHWYKLRGGDHSAVGDCQATLQLLKRIAGS